MFRPARLAFDEDLLGPDLSDATVITVDWLLSLIELNGTKLLMVIIFF